MWTHYNIELGQANDTLAKGWTLSSHHYWEPGASFLSKGNGTQLKRNSQIISTIAGNGDYAYAGDESLATEASLNPADTKVDAAGNLYIADTWNNRIRKIGADGIITTLAGNGTTGFSGDDGLAIAAALNRPYAIAIGNSNNIYIADTFNHRVRKLDEQGIITTIAGNGSAGFSGDNGLATDASLQWPIGLLLDSLGNLFIADHGNHRIRKVDPSGIITTVAGTGVGGFSGDNGPAIDANLLSPAHLAFDTEGNLFFTDMANGRIRKIDTSGIITTVAGNGDYAYSGDNGLAVEASLTWPMGLTIDQEGNLFFADSDNYLIRKVDKEGIITTVAGNGEYAYSGDNGFAANAAVPVLM